MKTTTSSLRFQTMVKEQTKKNNSFEGGRFFFFFPSLQGKTICVLKFNSCKCVFFFFFFPLYVNAVGVLYVDRVIVK